MRFSSSKNWISKKIIKTDIGQQTDRIWTCPEASGICFWTSKNELPSAKRWKRTSKWWSYSRKRIPSNREHLRHSPRKRAPLVPLAAVSQRGTFSAIRIPMWSEPEMFGVVGQRKNREPDWTNSLRALGEQAMPQLTGIREVDRLIHKYETFFFTGQLPDI